jgi:hypothetical protein
LLARNGKKVKKVFACNESLVRLASLLSVGERKEIYLYRRASAAFAGSKMKKRKKIGERTEKKEQLTKKKAVVS